MKESAYIDMFEETTIETKESVKNMIERLISQSGVCNTVDSNGEKLIFICDSKGNIRVDTSFYRNSSSSRRIPPLLLFKRRSCGAGRKSSC